MEHPHAEWDFQRDKMFRDPYQRATIAAYQRGLVPVGALRACQAIMHNVDPITGCGTETIQWLADSAVASPRAVQYWLREAEAEGLVITKSAGVLGLHLQLTTRLFDIVRDAPEAPTVRRRR